MFYESLADTINKITLAKYDNCVASLHFHQSIELIYCLSGKIKINCGASEYLIEKGQIAFIPCYFPHSVKTDGESSNLTFIIPYYCYKTFNDNKISLCYGKLIDKTVNDKILALLKDVSEVIDKQPSLLLNGYVTVILGLICDAYQPVDNEQPKIELMREIIEYVNQNSKEKITLESIAKQFGYSKYYFSRLFNKVFNCSLNFYINQVRKNKVLLEINKDKKLSDVIFENGFGTLSTFYRTK